MSEAIRVEAIRKTYPGAWRRPAKEALKGISLCIDAGETFGFIGTADIPLVTGSVLLVAINLALGLTCYSLLKSGWKLKN